MADKPPKNFLSLVLLLSRAETSSIFLGNESLRVAYFELELVSGSEISWLELYELLKFSELYPSPVCTTYIIISSPVEPSQKLAGLAEIWALAVSGIGLICCEFFFRPEPSNRVG